MYYTVTIVIVFEESKKKINIIKTELFLKEQIHWVC